MPRTLFVVDNPDRWPLDLPEVEVVSARTYLTDPCYSTLRGAKLYNLCRSYRYQSIGYYVSLLAEARGHKPLPRISTIQDIKSQSLTKVVSSDLEELIRESLAPLRHDAFTLSIYFSRNVAKRYDQLSRQLFNLFPVPLLRAEFVKRADGWSVQSVSPLSANEIPDEHRGRVIELAREYFEHRAHSPSPRTPPRYSMAILVDPADSTPPSNEQALEKFVEAGEKLSFDVEVIEPDDYGRVAEFDALFIRATTAVNHHTYRFARRAEAEGLVVIDDPASIVKCTNKVFLAELLARHRVPTPRTEILHRDNIAEVRQRLGLPIILKDPDSSFSRGVLKRETEPEYLQAVDNLLEESELLIAQEYIRTDFDWRIGILDERPLYACKYYMARDHWQIYNNASSGEDRMGDFETLPVEMAPKRVVSTALKAANLIGRGLYGVDLKTIRGNCCVIEVNDNPSIEAGVEDKMLRDYLYERIMEVFLKRLEAHRESFGPV
jgi:glutathione synthase/RimK-type ligase-like ATP-grasp enzyme